MLPLKLICIEVTVTVPVRMKFTVLFNLKFSGCTMERNCPFD
jgi:hypothetical protein